MNNSMFSVNLKKTRKERDESLDLFAENVGLSKGTISKYENEKMKPSFEHAKKIAEIAGVTLEDLDKKEISNVDYEKIVYDPYLLAEIDNLIFPIECSDDALKDDYFRRAFDLHKRIMKKMKNNIFVRADQDFSYCIENYCKSVEENHTLEASVNLLWFYIHLAHTINFTDEKSNELKKCKEREMKYLLKEKAFDMLIECEDVKKIKKNIEAAFMDELIELRNADKEQRKWSDLAHYYLALSYIYGINNNKESEPFNKKVGFEMMTSLCQLDNKYAKLLHGTSWVFNNREQK